MNPMADERDPGAEIAAATADLARLSAEAADLAAQQSTGTELVSRGDFDPERTRVEAVRLRAASMQKMEQIKQVQERLRQSLERQMSDARAALAPLQKQAAQLSEVLEAVEAMLGVGEDVVVIRDGSPAPEGTPLVIMQDVRAMDEESRLAAESGGIDVRDLDQFDEWLLADPKHLDQLIPFPKGVIGMVVRRSDRDYRDMDGWSAAQLNEANKRADTLLVRNGERLLMITSRLHLGRRLVPNTADFEGIFTRLDHKTGERVRLTPGTYDWRKAEEAADHRRRTFLKVALLLQGLAQRSTAFHPLPPAGLDLLDPATYENGHARIVIDGDASLMLTDGRPDFRTWLDALNANLRPGMRVVGNFRGQAWHNANDRDHHSRYSGHSRVRPNGAEYPPSDELLTIEDKDTNGDLIARYARTEETWIGRDYEYRVPKTRASVVLTRKDRFILAFDAVTVAEIDYYLSPGRARTEGEAYLELVPLLKSARTAKIAEEQAEEPFRALLAGQLLSDTVSLAEAEQALPSLVAWWKTLNRWHRPLVNPDPATEKKAIEQITAEFHRRREAAVNAEADQTVAERLRGLHPDALLIARARDGRYLVLVPQDEQNVFVRELNYGAGKRLLGSKDWVMPGARPNAWTIMWASERWADWNLGASASEHLTGPEIADLVEKIRAGAKAAEAERNRGWSRQSEDASTGEVLAVTFRNGALRERYVRAWLRPVLPTPDEAATPDYFRAPNVATVAMRWRRSTGGRVVTEDPRASSHHGWDLPEVGAFGGRYAVAPWRNEHQRADRVVFEDTALLADVERQRAALVAVLLVKRDLDRAVNELTRPLSAQWDLLADAQAKQEFVTEYGQDADHLWESHRQTVTIPSMPADVDAAVDALVLSLLKTGRAPESLVGLTVADAAALAPAGPDVTGLDLVASMVLGVDPDEDAGDEDAGDVEPMVEEPDLLIVEGVEIVSGDIGPVVEQGRPS